jgi:hypothetical protein
MPSALERARTEKGRAPIGATEAQRYGEWLVTEQRVPLKRLEPKTNPVELPTEDEVNLDRARLLSRLETFGLRARTVVGDGNCQFRAVSDQLYGDEAHHGVVRSVCVDQLLCTAERYKDYVVADTYDAYVAKMSQLGEWGDHVTLQALADSLGVEINLVTSFESGGLIRVTPQEPPAWQPRPPGGPPLWLAFWAEVHFNSIEMT